MIATWPGVSPTGKPTQLTTDESGNPVLVTEGSFAHFPAALNGNSDAVSFALAGLGSVYIQVKGTFTATYQIQGSIDGGTTWTDATSFFADLATGSFITSITAASVYVYSGALRPPTLMRIHCSAYTSGAPTGNYSYRAPH